MTNKRTDHGAIMRGIAYASMERSWSVEWFKLDGDDQANVVQDILDASETDESLTISEYQRRIGIGNLQSYADTIRHNYQEG